MYFVYFGRHSLGVGGAADAAAARGLPAREPAESIEQGVCLSS